MKIKGNMELTSRPMLPTPMTASVRPARPFAFPNSPFIHFPFLSAMTLSAMRRSRLIRAPIVSSATAIAFLPGLCGKKRERATVVFSDIVSRNGKDVMNVTNLPQICPYYWHSHSRSCSLQLPHEQSEPGWLWLPRGAPS